MTVANDTIHLWRKRVSGSEIFQRGGKEFVQCHHGFTNVVSSTPRLLLDEISWEAEHTESGRMLVARPNQKGIALMKDMGLKFSKLRKIVLDPFKFVLFSTRTGHFLRCPIVWLKMRKIFNG